MQFVSGDGEPLGGFDVTEAGTRKGLALWVVRDVNDVPRLASLGPEPFDLNVRDFTTILTSAGGSQVKGVLRDQSRIAGIGNAYSDEVLHVAKLSPFAPCRSLTQTDIERVHAAINITLSDAVERSVGQQPALLKAEKRAGMRVHGRVGEQCSECGDVVREVSFADSSLNYCATCQTGGKPLADRRMSRLLR
jgi:formamidopyrimidine-DNA glycosylase